MRRGGRVVEGARLESVYMPKAYQGFESLSLRHILNFPRSLLSKKSLIAKGILSFFIQVCPTLSVYIRIKRGHIRGHKLKQHLRMPLNAPCGTQRLHIVDHFIGKLCMTMRL